MISWSKADSANAGSRPAANGVGSLCASKVSRIKRTLCGGWRDAYPGVNAVTLMELRESPDPRHAEVLPVVRYAVARNIAKGNDDYWDYAAVLELAVLANDRDAADSALAAVRESWELRTTASNLRLIGETRTKRGEAQSWIQEIEGTLQQSAAATSASNSRH